MCCFQYLYILGGVGLWGLDLVIMMQPWCLWLLWWGFYTIWDWTFYDIVMLWVEHHRHYIFLLGLIWSRDSRYIALVKTRICDSKINGNTDIILDTCITLFIAVMSYARYPGRRHGFLSTWNKEAQSDMLDNPSDLRRENDECKARTASHQQLSEAENFRPTEEDEDAPLN